MPRAWPGAEKVGRSLWVNAAVFDSSGAKPSLAFMLPCGIRLIIGLPTDLASFLEDGAFNQMKPAS